MGMDAEQLDAELETRAYVECGVEVRAAAEGKPPGLTGYGYKWGDEAEFAGGVIVERIKRGAFAATLKRDDCKLMVGHDHRALPLARKETGTFRVSEDDTGLRFEADLDPDDPEAVSVMRKVAAGLADKMSVGFTMRRGGVERRIEPKGKGEPTVYEIERIGELMEISIVTWPAYNRTEVSARRRGLTRGLPDHPEAAAASPGAGEGERDQSSSPREDSPEPAPASPDALAAARQRVGVRLAGIMSDQLARRVNGGLRPDG